MATLSDIILDLCGRAGLDDSLVDVSQVPGAQPVSDPLGYLIERPTHAAAALQEILRAFFIDACESDGKLKFVPRSSGPIVQSAYVQELEPYTPSVSLPNSVRTGSYLLAFVNYRPFDFPTGSTPEISSTAGETWTPLYTTDGQGAWYAIANGGPDTISWSGFHEYNVDAYVVEVAASSIETAVATGTGVVTATLGDTTLSIGSVGSLTPWLVILVKFGSQPFVLGYLAQSLSASENWYLPSGWSQVFPDAATSWSAVLSTGRSLLLIPEDDLGLREDQAKLVEQFAQEQDLPEQVTVVYNDAALNYQQGKQLKARNARTLGTRNQKLLSLPFSLTADQARRIAEATLSADWENRLAYTINLWRASYLLLDPTDWVQFVYEDVTYMERLTAVNIGQGAATALEGVRDYAGNYSSSASGAGHIGFNTGATRSLGGTVLLLFDLPYFADRDASAGSTGLYFALSSGSSDWPGGALYESTDDTNFDQTASSSSPSSFGYATEALAAPASPWAWDTVNTLTIQMQRGTLAGSTDDAVLAGANKLVVGSELLQFVNCTDNGGGSYTISRLLRGRRGTEGACGSHSSGEPVALADTLLRDVHPLSDLAILRYFRGVTVGDDVTSAESQSLTPAGNDLKPYSPVAIGGSKDGTTNNWTMSWFRRTRYGGAYGTGDEALIDGMGGPINEQSEAYEIDILDGATVKRTIKASTPSAIYTADQQTTDFGGVQTTLSVKVYQISAAVGRGFPGAASLPASTDAPVSLPPAAGGWYVN